MVVIAHTAHWTLGLLQVTPVLAVAAFALWKSRDARRQTSQEAAAG